MFREFKRGKSAKNQAAKLTCRAEQERLEMPLGGGGIHNIGVSYLVGGVAQSIYTGNLWKAHDGGLRLRRTDCCCRMLSCFRRTAEAKVLRESKFVSRLESQSTRRFAGCVYRCYGSQCDWQACTSNWEASLAVRETARS